MSLRNQLDTGVISLYDRLIDAVTELNPLDSRASQHHSIASSIVSNSSRRHAQEAHRQGQTISQLVRSYGDLSQIIIEHSEDIGETIGSTEFSRFNLCMDEAIAQAVTEFQSITVISVEKSERMKLGVLVHELRNSLASAMLSHQLILRDAVGSKGATSQIMTNSLNRMRDLIDRSVAEARMERSEDLAPTIFSLFDILNEIEMSLLAESIAKGVTIVSEIDTTISMKADRHIIVSAITNLLQNAIKYTARNRCVIIRAFIFKGDAVIEIEDRCGGLDETKIPLLFDPYVQANTDRSGIGLGLSIVQKACALTGCNADVRNLPGEGCVFSIKIPAACLAVAVTA